jgi:hypothetical protein
MHFGLCNDPAKFEKVMEKVLRGLTYDSHLLYLDDVIVIGRTLDEHLLNLRKVFKWFLVDRIEFNSEKCQLLQKEVRYLGNIILPKQISTDTEKLKAVRECPTPKNKHEIRSFLGLCTYYRRFIPGFANIAKLLAKFTEQNQPFQWNFEEEAAFEIFKGALCIDPIRAYLQPGKSSSWTRTPITSELDECSPKHRKDRSGS